MKIAILFIFSEYFILKVLFFLFYTFSTSLSLLPPVSSHTFLLALLNIHGLFYHELLLHSCLYSYIYIPKYNLLNMLLIRMFSGLTTWYWITNWCLVSWKLPVIVCVVLKTSDFLCTIGGSIAVIDVSCFNGQVFETLWMTQTHRKRHLLWSSSAMFCDSWVLEGFIDLSIGINSHNFAI